MINKDFLCPNCGKVTNTLIENMCSFCFYNKITKNLKISNVIKVSLCSDCNCFLYKKKWEKYDSLKTIFEKLIFEKINKENKLLSVNIKNYKKISDFLYNVTIEYGINIYDNKTIEIRMKFVQCITCNKKSGGYFESIIQCRFISKEKKLIIDNIINSLIEKYKKIGNKLSFISRSIDTKNGIDYYIGSISIAKRISKYLYNSFCSTYKESYTLIGIKNNKKVYRTTILLRFSSINNGDIFYFKKDIFIVEKLSINPIIINLSNYCKVSINIIILEKVGIYLGNKYKNNTNAMIVCIEKETITMLDLETYDTFSIKKLKQFNFKSGENIPIFKCQYGTFLLI